MAFKITCPGCQKAYAAEDRWVGRRIRCKQCGEAFVVEQPSGELAMQPMPASAVPIPSSAESLSGRSATKLAVPRIQVPPSQVADSNGDAESDDLFSGVSSQSPLRASIPQAFPMSAVVEAWLPLALALIAIVWGATQTFSSNETGKVWVAPLRFGIVALLYVGVIAPLTYRAVVTSFRHMRRLLPPNPLSRVATTFALPTCLALVFWQVSSGIGGLITGLIMGLVLMAAVFWLVFRLDPQEAANTYAKASGYYLAGVTASALIIVGVNSLVNHAMVEAHAVAYKESPLGAPLAWKTPEPVARPQPKVAPEESLAQTATTSPTTDIPLPRDPVVDSHPKKSSPVAPLVSNTPVSSNPASLTPPPESAIVNTSGSVTETKPDQSSHLFVNPDDDQFVANLRKNQHPWIKQITRPNNPGPYDLFLAGSGMSQYVGFVALDSSTPSLRRFSVGFASPAGVSRSGNINVYDSESVPLAFVHDYFLTPDGMRLLHRVGHDVEIIATGQDRRESIPLVPPDKVAPNAMTPQIVGVTAQDDTFVVKWSGVDAVQDVIQRYSYTTHKLVSSGKMSGAALLSDVAAVSQNDKGPIWFAGISAPVGRRPCVVLFNVTSVHGEQKTAALPNSLQELGHYDHMELSLSPNAGKLAMMLADGDKATVCEWGTDSPGLPALTVSVPALSSAASTGRCVGPRIQWIDDLVFIVDGEAVVGTAPTRSGILGTLSDTPVVATSVVSPDRILMNYFGDDSNYHMVDVQFDANALRSAAVTR